MHFSTLQLSEPILRAVAAEGYLTATPIQQQTIVPALEGRDVLGCAQTGTGKTAAFALPILHRLSTVRPTQPGRARCLVLCPTRELAVQIADSFRTYGKNLHIKLAVVFGGVGQHPQVQAMRQGAQVIIATPGRLLDLMDQGHVHLQGIETLVLDEADRMLDMGFINDIRKIAEKLPAKRQTLLFSATMPTEIRKLAETLLHDPVKIQVAPAKATADGIEQSVYFVDRANKPDLLAQLLSSLSITRALVFTRTKHGADRVVRNLYRSGIKSEAIHGNKAQGARQRALENFRVGKTHVLVATDIASRGIDVDGISHVFNYDLPHEPETYVHRIGRTARAGATGVALALCAGEEVGLLRDIERMLRKPITVKTHELALSTVPMEHDSPRPQRGHSRGHGAGHGHGHAPRKHNVRAHHSTASAGHKPGSSHKTEGAHIGEGASHGKPRQPAAGGGQGQGGSGAGKRRRRWRKF